jgi:hypothetical protein
VDRGQQLHGRPIPADELLISDYGVQVMFALLPHVDNQTYSLHAFTLTYEDYISDGDSPTAIGMPICGYRHPKFPSPGAASLPEMMGAIKSDALDLDGSGKRRWPEHSSGTHSLTDLKPAVRTVLHLRDGVCG